MPLLHFSTRGFAALCGVLLWALLSGSARAESDTAATGDKALIERGRYVFQAANCLSCHTDFDNDGKPLAGGRELKTPFGSFVTPNITPDPETGIGDWSDKDFIRALTEGVSPEGEHYYPSFPWTAYRGMKHDDLIALKRYLDQLEPVRQKNPPHRLKWFVQRWTLGPWKWLNHDKKDYPGTNPDRGAYLVNVLGHCQECHSPRDAIGRLRLDRSFRGNPDLEAPNIRNSDDGIGDWSDDELNDLFTDGMLPDGDYVSSKMAEVVDYATSNWSEEDRKAVIRYLRSLK